MFLKYGHSSFALVDVYEINHVLAEGSEDTGTLEFRRNNKAPAIVPNVTCDQYEHFMKELAYAATRKGLVVDICKILDGCP